MANSDLSHEQGTATIRFTRNASDAHHKVVRWLIDVLHCWLDDRGDVLLVTGENFYLEVLTMLNRMEGIASVEFPKRQEVNSPADYLNPASCPPTVFVPEDFFGTLGTFPIFFIEIMVGRRSSIQDRENLLKLMTFFGYDLLMQGEDGLLYKPGSGVFPLACPLSRLSCVSSVGNVFETDEHYLHSVVGNGSPITERTQSAIELGHVVCG